jgi:hypothetical protein
MEVVMKSRFLFLATLLTVSAASAGQVTCYNDDSLEVINQDELMGGRLIIDCSGGPKVTFDVPGPNTGSVYLDGVKIYSGGMDPAIEARVAPTIVAILTQRGSLYLYSKGEGLRRWYDFGNRSMTDFKLSSSGSLMAITSTGALVANGHASSTHRKAVTLYASASGRVAALLDDGTIVDGDGVLYGRTVDPAGAVKIAADGTVVWMTRGGRIGSTRNGEIYSGADPAVSFKISDRGAVAYLTRDGKLGRDGHFLQSGAARVAQYRIQPSLAVTATTTDGKALVFR